MRKKPRKSLVRKARRSGKRGKKRRSVLWRVVVVLIAFGLPAFTIYLFHLSQIVMARFEGTKWKIPSRIYSDSLTVSEGLSMKPEFLEERLKRVSYRLASSSPPETGEYATYPEGHWEIGVREFDFPDRRASAQRVRFSLARGHVENLEDGSGKKLRNASIEPEVISGLYSEIWESRDVVKLAAVPEDLVRAILAIEDRRFYRHFGMDPKGLARAMWVNLRARRFIQGGSTITQQLVKNLFLTQARTLTRKMNELFMAFILEGLYSKDEILETYLNEVYLGQRGPMGIHGVAEAARFFFGKPLSSLDLAECATIAGIVRSPGTYSPYLHPEAAKARRDVVLAVMTDQNVIPAGRAAEARDEPLATPSTPPRPLGAPYFVDFVRAELAQSYSQETLTTEGLKVFTTLDPLLQREAERAVREGIEKLEGKHKRLRPDGDDRLQGILVSLSRTGSIQALVGGRNYKETQFNRVVQARRQPGSLFKPFVYAAAFAGAGGARDPAVTLATILDDSQMTVRYDNQRWTPSNYDNFYRGPVTVYEALTESLNVPAARTGIRVGPRSLARFIRTFGFEGKLAEVPSLALGAADVSPLEIAAAYGAFLNEGNRVRPVSIKDVVDRKGRVLKRHRLTLEEVIPAEIAYLVTTGLEGVMDFGTARWARNLGLAGAAAGKTGTTNDYRDAWFAGFTPDSLALVWVGFDQKKALGLQGAAAALPIWVDYMKAGGLERPGAAFAKPRGIVFEEVDATTGMIATGECPRTFKLPFREGTEPMERCTAHPTLVDRLKSGAESIFEGGGGREETPAARTPPPTEPTKPPPPEPTKLPPRAPEKKTWFEELLE